MRFSVIVPAHNEEAIIADAMDSIRRQTFHDLEVIVVADRCSDGTCDVVRSRGVEPLEVDVGHPGLARNAGMDRAVGEFLLFLDADDRYVDDQALGRLDAALTAENDPDVLHFGFLWGRQLTSPVAWHGAHYGMVWARAWRRSFVADTRFPASRFAEDLDFCSLVYARSPRHATFPAPLVAYEYPRPGSLTWDWFRTTRTEQARARRG